MIPLLWIGGALVLGALGYKLYEDAHPSATGPNPPPKNSPKSNDPIPPFVPGVNIPDVPKGGTFPDVVPPFIPGVMTELKTGDEAVIPLSKVPGANMLQIPVGAKVLLRIDSSTTTTVTGPLVGVIKPDGQVNRLPVPSSSMTVSRTDVERTQPAGVNLF